MDTSVPGFGVPGFGIGAPLLGQVRGRRIEVNVA
jgi:hypothetical protein